MEVEGSNLNAFLESFMGDIPSNDEYADLETNTADLEANTADVMLMSKSGSIIVPICLLSVSRGT